MPWRDAAGTCLLIVAAILSGFLLRGTVALVHAAAGPTAPPRPPSSQRLELANRCTVHLDGTHVNVTSVDGRPMFTLDLAGDVCDVTGVLNQGDGIHVFFGTTGPSGESLTVLRVSPRGSRIVLRRALGSGSWTLRDHALLIYAHREVPRVSEVLRWNGRAYDRTVSPRVWE